MQAAIELDPKVNLFITTIHPHIVPNLSPCMSLHSPPPLLPYLPLPLPLCLLIRGFPCLQPGVCLLQLCLFAPHLLLETEG